MEDKKQKNILLIPSVFDNYGIIGSIEIIKDLISLGHTVTCYILDEFEERFKKSGAKLKTFKIDKTPLKNLPPYFAQRIYFSFTIGKFYDEILNDALKSDEKYDFLIVDSFIDGNEINKIFKIPTVITLYSNPLGEKTPFIELYAQKRLEFILPVNKKYNLNIIDFLSIHFMAETKYKLMLTSKLFQPQSLLSDNSFYFIGPSSQEEKPNDESFNFKKDENKKLINISLVPILSQNIDFFKLCVKAFGSSKEYQIIMDVGKRIDIKELGDLPENFSVFNNVPQSQILPQTDVIIIDGGIEAINEVFYYNNKLPFILIKQDINEFDNSKIIKKYEAGIVLNDKKLTPEILKEVVINYLSNKSKYQKGMDIISESFKEAKSQRKEILEKIFGQ